MPRLSGSRACSTTPLAGPARHVGDPVDVVTGRVFDVETDFRVQRGAHTFSFTRHFDGGALTHVGSVGRSMCHVLEAALRVDLDGMRVELPDESVVRFPFFSADGVSERAGSFRLTRESQLRYTLRARDGRAWTWQFGDPLYPARLLQAHLFGLALTLSHDRAGRLERAHFGDGAELLFAWSGEQLASVRLLEDGGTKRTTLIQYAYDGSGRLVTIRDAYNFDQQLRYDYAHRLLEKVDRRGYAFRFTYDGAGRCTETAGEDGAELHRLAYVPLERRTEVTRADGGTTTYFYDAQGAIVSVLDPYGAARTYVSDGAGRIVEERDPHNNALAVVYDADDEVVAKVDAFGAVHHPDPEQDTRIHSHWVPDAPLAYRRGRDAEQPASLPLADVPYWRVPEPLRELLSTTPTEGGGRFTRVRNVQGLPLWDERDTGERRRYAFDPNANVRWDIDADGARTDYAYLSDNHLSERRDALGRVEQFTHSPYEKLTAYVDAGGTRSSYGYDLVDRLVTVSRHDRVRESYVYDKAGNLVEKRNPRGEALFKASYGPGNRERARTWLHGETQRFTYDAGGRLTEAEGEAGRCTFGYRFGRRCRDERDGAGVVHGFRAGTLSSVTVLGRFATTYARDADGALRVTDPAGTEHVLREPVPGVHTRVFADWVAEGLQYDLDGRVLAQADYDPVSERRLVQRLYRYSPEGWLQSVRDADAGHTLYAHDEVHRLQAVYRPDGVVEHYRYDAGNNLVEAPGLGEHLPASGPQHAPGTPLQPVVLDTGNRLWRANGERFHHDERDHVVARESHEGVTYYLRDARRRHDLRGLVRRARPPHQAAHSRG